MPSKRKKSHNLKHPADPLGERIFFCPLCTTTTTHLYIINFMFFVSDDILRKNLFLAKYVRSADQLKQLGKSPHHTFFLKL